LLYKLGHSKDIDNLYIFSRVFYIYANSLKYSKIFLFYGFQKKFTKTEKVRYLEYFINLKDKKFFEI